MNWKLEFRFLNAQFHHVSEVRVFHGSCYPFFIIDLFVYISLNGVTPFSNNNIQFMTMS